MINNSRDKYINLAVQYGEYKKNGEAELANKVHQQLSETSDAIKKLIQRVLISLLVL